jgi:predicted acylesterase/phospholipase RssA
MSHLVRGTLRQALGDGDLRAAPLEALAVATRVRDLECVMFSSREEKDFVEPLLGSCFFPLLYGRPVLIRGQWLVDGGLKDNLPVEELQRRGADDIVAVVTSVDGTALKTPFRQRWRPQVAGARVHVIHPRVPLAIKSWDFDRDRMLQAIDEGYQRGREFAA